MRCCVCNKKLNKENAYKFAWFNYGSKRYHNKYFCNKEECNKYFKDKKYRKLLMETIGEILGDKRNVSCVVDKRIDELKEKGFDYEEVLEIVRKLCFDFANIENESDKIKHIFKEIENYL